MAEFDAVLPSTQPVFDTETMRFSRPVDARRNLQGHGNA